MAANSDWSFSLAAHIAQCFSILMSNISFYNFFPAPCDLSDEDMSLIGDGELSSSSSSKKGPGGVMAGGGPGGSGGLSGKKTANDRKSARARTVLSEKQLNILKTCYSANPRPDALMKEQLVEMTALSPRVIRVWFQNKRCKDKKIQNRLMEKQIQRESVSTEKFNRWSWNPMLESFHFSQWTPVLQSLVSQQTLLFIRSGSWRWMLHSGA